MDDVATIITSLADGAAAISSGFVSVISKLVGNPQVLTLIGLAIGFGIVKLVLNRLPMIKSRR